MQIDLRFNPALDTRSENVHKLKCLWATYHFLTISKDDTDIAKAINVSPQKLDWLKRTPHWDQAMCFWNPGYKQRTRQSIRRSRRRKG